MPSPFDQSTYQVRLDWGVAGLARLAPADVVVVVDVLRFSSTVTDAVAAGAEVDLADAVRVVDQRRGRRHGGRGYRRPPCSSARIRNASAVARAVQTVQERRQARTSVAVIAAGELDEAGDAPLRRRGPPRRRERSSPRSPTWASTTPHRMPRSPREGFRALRRALRHTAHASGSARELETASRRRARMAASGVVPTTPARCRRARRGRRRAGAARRTVHAFE